mmetsp:Transcript_48932/g.81242  ORF Transcript_48932/g.81242 Transcript_48932/m.81242 type:complete len:448 (-) Transcript_48932:198-1541(-)
MSRFVELLLLCSAVHMMLPVMSSNVYLEEACDRVRRPLHLLSTKELMLTVNGMQAIKANGKYQVIVDTHMLHTTVHRGSSFFFYHTYFVWEVETQIRALGGEYECYAMPYYDFSIEAGNELDPFILNSVFGGDGLPPYNCVGGPLWTVDRWPLPDLCEQGEKNHDPDASCCLKRHLNEDASIVIASAEKLGTLIAENAEFRPFEQNLAYEHQMVHWLFAKEDCGPCAMATGRAPQDPVFMVLHAGVAYYRALWAACYGYDEIAADDLDEHPEAYTAACEPGLDECDVIELDEPYVFDTLATMDWSLTSQREITPRMMWEFADWGVTHEEGDFYQRSGLGQQDVCKDTLFDSEWFYAADDTATDADVDVAAMQKHGGAVSANSPTLNSSANDTFIIVLSAFVVVLLAVAAAMLYRKFHPKYVFGAAQHKYTLIKDANPGTDYGSTAVE